MKKFLCLATALLVSLASVLTSLASPSAQTPVNWYFRSSHDGSQPQLISDSELLTKYPLLAMGPEGDKTVYLTFDAGYSNKNLEKTLDVLKSHNVKGAFFILPGIVNNSPEVVKRMYDEGHLICNHSYSHCDMSQITDRSKFEKELADCESHLQKTLGIPMSRFFRPPEGAFSEQMLIFCAETGYIPVFWSFAHADWDNSKQPTAQETRDRILTSLHDGMVLLLHPTSSANAAALDGVLTELKRRGYSFGTLPELCEKCNLHRETKAK